MALGITSHSAQHPFLLLRRAYWQLRPAIARASLTQTSWPRTSQQLGLFASFEQSEAWAQTCSVSVPWHVVVKLVLQLASHREDSDWTMQLGACPPWTATVSQQSRPLLQSPGCRHSSVSVDMQAGEQAIDAAPAWVQHTSPGLHGGVGHPKVAPPLLEPLPPPLELPLPLPPPLELPLLPP